MATTSHKISRYPIELFFDVFFPHRCVNCGKLGLVLCVECAGGIEINRTSTCPKCGRMTQYGDFCKSCRNAAGNYLHGAIIACQYEGAVKELIHYFKYEGFMDILPLLGELVAERLKSGLPPGELVTVPVPLHLTREKMRGFNQSELLARFVSERFGIPGGMALERTRKTESQMKLGKAERLTNIAGAFRVVDAELIEKKTVLLVDDVATTMATLNECARVLKEAGAKKVYGLVVARGR